MKNELIDSFQLRVHDESYERINKCLAMLSEDQVWYSPDETIPTIGNLILHLCGNVRQWILTGVGERTGHRERDSEFELGSRTSKEELQNLMKDLSAEVNEYFQDITSEDLYKEIVVQGFKVTGFSAVVHVIEHFSYHTGQITTLTKLMTGKETNYFQDVDLNK